MPQTFQEVILANGKTISIWKTMDIVHEDGSVTRQWNTIKSRDEIIQVETPQKICLVRKSSLPIYEWDPISRTVKSYPEKGEEDAKI